MTILEAINQVDTLKPNSYLQTDKIRWLSNLEWSIKREIIDTHEGAENIAFNGFDKDTPLNTELIAPTPYDEIYLRWLEAQIDYANGESGRYNNSIAMYNAAVVAFSNYYNREHMPLQNNSIKYF